MNSVALVVAMTVLVPLAANDAPSAAERGRIALTTRLFTPAIWTTVGYENAWKQWQPALKQAPLDYDQAFREHYGLHPAPYDNGSLPMGLRAGSSLIIKNAMAYDCMLCHAGSIAGKSYMGLGNSSLDLQAVFEDFGKASGTLGKTPIPVSNVRGTSEAGAAAIFLLSYRNPDLSLRLKRLDLDLQFDLCEDAPAWWHLKKKKTMYHTGSTNARSVRALMQFMLSPANSASVFTKEESTFKDIQAYLLTLEAPKYPFPIDQERAALGLKVFTKTCARCHGTYGADWTYPNKIVPIDVIGTDRTLIEGFSPKLTEHYNKSWFAQEGDKGRYAASGTAGYQAPPLDGVWATAPYLHNGSVPTLYDMLNSKSRPKIFTRSFKTGVEDYDQVKVGWEIRELGKAAPPGATPYERRRIYDTTQPGRGNQGHTFGDQLNDDERRAVIEYLKTLSWHCMFAHYADWEYGLAAFQLSAFMIAMGAKLVPAQFLQVLRKPRSFLFALGGHLFILPLLAVAINHLAGLETGLALGLILVAAMPGGTLAKIFTYFGHGNVPLSITLSGVSTLLTVFTIPLMLRLLTREMPEEIALPVPKIIAEVALYLLLPLVTSMGLCRRHPILKKPLATWGVVLGLAVVGVMIVGSLASGRIKPGTYGWTAPLAIIFFCVLGQQINQLPFYVMRWPREDRMAAGMEVTMRNMNLALLLYASLFRNNARIAEEVLFVLLFYAATAMIVGTPLALRHRRMAKRASRAAALSWDGSPEPSHDSIKV